MLFNIHTRQQLFCSNKMSLINVFLFFLFFHSIIYTSTAQVRKKEGLSLGERYQHLYSSSQRKPIIRINGAIFRDYIKATPRNYSMIVMFTAMAPQRQCMICRVASDEFQIVANSFRYSQAYSNKLFFGVVDFDEGTDVFNHMRLNTAPAFIHFPPKGKPKPADNMDIQRVGFGAEAIAKWIADRTDIQIRVFRPPNYSGAVAFFMIFTIICGFLYVRRNTLDFSKFYNKNLWGTFALMFTLAMISGQMWNHIRSPPFVHKTQNGGIAYINGSSQGQFIFETYIIIVLGILLLLKCKIISLCSAEECTWLRYVKAKVYFLNEIIIDGLMVLGMILMTEAAQKKGDITKRRTLAIIGLFLFVLFFSLVLVIFRTKAHGYPYSFLFK